MSRGGWPSLVCSLQGATLQGLLQLSFSILSAVSAAPKGVLLRATRANLTKEGAVLGLVVVTRVLWWLCYLTYTESIFNCVGLANELVVYNSS